MQIAENSNEVSNLFSGESYIMFNNLKGKTIIWINCDKEMQYFMDNEELISAAPTLFPELNISELLFYLKRGDYIFTDKLTIRPLKPQIQAQENAVPMLKDILPVLKSNKSQKTSLYSFNYSR